MLLDNLRLWHVIWFMLSISCRTIVEWVFLRIRWANSLVRRLRGIIIWNPRRIFSSLLLNLQLLLLNLMRWILRRWADTLWPWEHCWIKPFESSRTKTKNKNYLKLAKCWVFKINMVCILFLLLIRRIILRLIKGSDIHFRLCSFNIKWNKKRIQKRI